MTSPQPAALRDPLKWAALIRLVVGAVFLSEGIQKFLYPAQRGSGRFQKIGLPEPELLANFVGVVEIVCGTLLLVGLLTRLAAVPLIIDMLVAIVSTKIPILLGHGFWGFALRDLPNYGFWSMADEMRTDWAMLLGSLFLLLVGAGSWSLDRLMVARPAAVHGAGANVREQRPHLIAARLCLRYRSSI